MVKSKARMHNGQKIMRIRNIISATTILLVIASCQHPDGGQVIVSGSLADADRFKLVLQEMDTKAIRSIDSVILDHGGKFDFIFNVSEPGFWLLRSPEGKVMVLLLNAGDRVELSGSAGDFPDNVILKGPEEALLLNEFFRFTRSNEHKVDSLEMLLVERQDSSDYYQLTQQLDTSFRQIWESQRNYEMAFIDNHPGSLASLIVLNYAFGMSPVLSPDEDSAYYVTLDSTLSRQFPGNKHVKFHHRRIKENKSN
jgi:hypothetical protein